MREDLERTQSANSFDSYQNRQQSYSPSIYRDNYGGDHQNGGYNGGYDGYPPQNGGGSNTAIIVVIIIATVIILALGGVVTFFLLNNNDSDSKEPITTTAAATTAAPTEAQTQVATVAVVNVEGAKDDDAYQKLNDAGVRYTVSRQVSTEVDEGYVISQSPKDGFIKKDEKVTLYISKGSGKTSSQSSEQAVTAAQSSVTPDPPSPPKYAASSSDYILPYSDSRRYTESEIKTLSKTRMNYALNEIYAREGRLFKDQQLQSYFNSKSWYHGYIDPAVFDSDIPGHLNTYERYNVDLIVRVQKQLGYR